MDNTQVTIFLTTPEAKMWSDFQQFHETFALMVKKGVFDCKNGTVEINFNEHGQIGSISKREMIYKQGK